jgi:hypothetical protein
VGNHISFNQNMCPGQDSNQGQTYNGTSNQPIGFVILSSLHTVDTKMLCDPKPRTLLNLKVKGKVVPGLN